MEGFHPPQIRGLYIGRIGRRAHLHPEEMAEESGLYLAGIYNSSCQRILKNTCETSTFVAGEAVAGSARAVSPLFSSASVSSSVVIVDRISYVRTVNSVNCSSASVVAMVGIRVNSGTTLMVAGVAPTKVVKAGGSTGDSTILVG